MLNKIEYHEALQAIPKNWGTRKRLTRYVELTAEYMKGLEQALVPMAECVTEGVNRDGVTMDEANRAYDILSFGYEPLQAPEEIAAAHLQEDLEAGSGN